MCTDRVEGLQVRTGTGKVEEFGRIASHTVNGIERQVDLQWRYWREAGSTRELDRDDDKTHGQERVLPAQDRSPRLGAYNAALSTQLAVRRSGILRSIRCSSQHPFHDHPTSS